MTPLLGYALVAAGIALCIAGLAAGRYIALRGGRMPLAPLIAGWAAVVAGAMILATH